MRMFASIGCCIFSLLLAYSSKILEFLIMFLQPPKCYKSSLASIIGLLVDLCGYIFNFCYLCMIQLDFTLEGRNGDSAQEGNIKYVYLGYRIVTKLDNLRRPGFEPGSGQVGFVLDKMALG
jgi:hypothetical protein